MICIVSIEITEFCFNAFAVCPPHCQACSESGNIVKCNADRCDLGYGVSLEGKCEGDYLQLLLASALR